jgi:hypothetical protein
MTRLLLAAAAGLAIASPAFALSVTATPAAGTQAAAKFTDPDEALSGLAKQFVGSAETAERQTPALRGPMATYDLSADAKQAKWHDGLADLSADPGNPDFNPFTGGRLGEDSTSRSH